MDVPAPPGELDRLAGEAPPLAGGEYVATLPLSTIFLGGTSLPRSIERKLLPDRGKMTPASLNRVQGWQGTQDIMFVGLNPSTGRAIPGR